MMIGAAQPLRIDANDGSGNTDRAIAYWQKNKWLERESVDGVIRIRRGERARKLLEGGESNGK